MAQANQDPILDIISSGLANFANATGDTSMLGLGATAYRDVQDAFAANIRPGDTCTFAFPSVVVLPDIRTECFMAILSDRVIVAWRKGMFKKTTISRVIPKDTIRQASWAISSQPSTRGATLLTITTNETINIALPRGKPAAADAITAAVRGN